MTQTPARAPRQIWTKPNFTRLATSDAENNLTPARADGVISLGS